MASTPLLSIGIPVYNGAHELPALLDSIIAQVPRPDSSTLEIIISDNCSTDEIASVIQAYKKNAALPLFYFRNESNLGYDRNIDLVVSRATGKYVWLIGCGEQLKPHAINTVLTHLNSGEYVNLLVNFDIYEEDHAGVATKRNFPFTADRVFDSKDAFFRTTGTGITPVSANIVSRELYLRVIDRPLRETGWAHFERIVALRSDTEGRSLCIQDVLFTLKREREGWWTRSGNLYLNSIRLRRLIMAMREQDYDPSTVAALLTTDTPYTLLAKIVIAKRQGLRFSLSILRDSRRSMPFAWYAILLPFLLLPAAIYSSRSLAAVVARFRSPQKENDN